MCFFKLVILAKVINDKDKVIVTALAVSKLVNLLDSKQEQVVVQTGESNPFNYRL